MQFLNSHLSSMCSINVGSVITYFIIKYIFDSVTSLQPAFGSVQPAIPKQVQYKCTTTKKYLPRLLEVLQMLSLCVNVPQKACLHACMHECTKIHTQISLTVTEVRASNPWKEVSRILSLLPSVLSAGCLRDCFVHFLFSMYLTFVISFLSEK